MLRGTGYSTFEIFDVAIGQKRAFSSFDFWELKNFYFNVTLSKRVYWAKFEGKLFPMRNTLDRSYRDRLLITFLTMPNDWKSVKTAYWQQLIIISWALWIVWSVQLNPSNCEKLILKVVRQVSTTLIISWLSICKTFISILECPVKFSQTKQRKDVRWRRVISIN